MPSSVQSRMDTLLRDLREGATEQRQHAAQALRDYGAAAVEPLCLALRDKDLNVRVAAAESLGLVGDERAVQSLVEAIQAHFVRQSIHFYVSGGLTFISVSVWFLAAFIWPGNLLEKMSPIVLALLLIGLVNATVRYQRRPQSKVCRVIIDALACIAKRNPSPELRTSLPQLRAVADDVFQDRRTRKVSRQVAKRIEALTEQLKSLPLPAAAPAPDAATLPRAADANAPETERLPRVTVNESLTN